MATENQLIDALAQIAESQSEVEAAKNDLVNHNTDPEAHPDIQEIINRILQSPIIYTEAQVTSLIQAALQEHVSKSLDEAHTGYGTLQTQVTDRLAQIEERLATLEARMQGRMDGPTNTELQRQIQQIEDKWAAVLASLMTSYAEAEAQGSTAVMAEVQEAIAQALSDKKAEILAVLDEYANRG